MIVKHGRTYFLRLRYLLLVHYATNINMRSVIYDTVTLKCVKSRVPWYHSNLHSFSIYNNIIMVIIQQVLFSHMAGSMGVSV